MSRRSARRLRRAVQFGFLLFFLVVGFATFQSFTPGRAAEGLFPFDPLAAFAAMLAGRTWIGGMAWAFGTLALTVVLGRVWCGWICPLGTTLEYVRFKSAARREARVSPRWRTVKYVLLSTIVVMAAFGSMSFLVLDPITIFNRTVATAVVPLVDGAVRGIESLAGDVSRLSGAVDWVNSSVRGTVLPRTQPFFWQGVVIGGIFGAVVALNLLADRFWCRYLCPLGALLGAFSKFALFRPLVNESCSGCRRCASACRLGAIEVADATDTPPATDDAPADAGITPEAGVEAPATAVDTPAAAVEAPATAAVDGPRCPGGSMTVVTSECTMCTDCLVACPDGASMRFGRAHTTGPWQPYDPGRREVLASAVLGVGAVALLGTGPWQGERPRAVLRPPGVTDEDDFLSTCIRCGACVSVCPTSGLQPAGGQAGAAGFWTPVLEPRRGYCEYTCTACGSICPSD
ncbi:MAG: 4Fe-4S binding protein, partial [Actinobacteria bacterium]|nr:4Fe-4S binding protein [Actinomycetota bacterium]